MDLAMPGMDGWETIRRLREGGLSDAEIAIISANAFDKGGDNEVGIGSGRLHHQAGAHRRPADWIGQRLKLEWVSADVIAGTHHRAAANTMARTAARRLARTAGTDRTRLSARHQRQTRRHRRRRPGASGIC
jgi:hypothetical protein